MYKVYDDNDDIKYIHIRGDNDDGDEDENEDDEEDDDDNDEDSGAAVPIYPGKPYYI